MNYTTTITDAELKYYSDLEFNNRCYKRLLERSKRERAKQQKFRRTITRMIMFAIVFGLCAKGLTLFIDNMEIVSYTARVDLMDDVMEGDENAIAIFERYIDRDIYLYNGPRTIEAMAKKYNLDVNELTESFNNSGYETLQEFFNKEIKPNVK